MATHVHKNKHIVQMCIHSSVKWDNLHGEFIVITVYV